MPQVDRFDMEKVGRYHSERDKIPSLPHLTELLSSWDTKVRPRFRRQRGEVETRALRNMQNRVAAFDGKHRTQSTDGQQVQDVDERILIAVSAIARARRQTRHL